MRPALHSFLIIRFDPHLAMHVKTGDMLQDVEVRGPVRIVTGGLNCSDNRRNTGFLIEGQSEKLRQTLCRTLTQFTQQLTVIKKISSKIFLEWRKRICYGKQDRVQFLSDDD